MRPALLAAPIRVVDGLRQQPRAGRPTSRPATRRGKSLAGLLDDADPEARIRAEAEEGVAARLFWRSRRAESRRLARRDGLRQLRAGMRGSNAGFRDALLLAAFALAGCDHDHGYCRGQHCVCVGQPDCEIGCLVGGCDVSCASTNQCTTGCAGPCRVACNDATQCDSECGDDCDLACARASGCSFRCGARCDVRCSDVTQCSAEVGEGGQVECARLSACDVTCDGPCSVACSEVSSCNVTCPPGLSRCEQSGAIVCAERC